MQEIKRNKKGELDTSRLKDFIRKQSLETKLYIGCDSFKFIKNGVKMAKFTSVVVVHIDGCKGCAVFGNITEERDYDKVKKRPSMRLMNEVFLASELYLAIGDIIYEYDVEVHLDISPEKKNGSSIIVQQAIGYVRGVCGITPKVKPDSFASSHAADRFRSYGHKHKDLENNILYV